MSARTKIHEAIRILEALGLPLSELTDRRRERVALAFLAVADVKPRSQWQQARVFEATNPRTITTREIIEYWNRHFRQDVSPGSYDDVRRRDLRQLVLSGIVLASAKNPDANTNNPTRGYAISPDVVDVLRRFGDASWESVVQQFCLTHGTLKERLERPRQFKTVPVTLPNGQPLELTIGAHNDLQKAIVEAFLPRFAPGAELLYIGDTSKKSLFMEETRLSELGFFELAHDALPDIVAYDVHEIGCFLSRQFTPRTLFHRLAT